MLLGLVAVAGGCGFDLGYALSAVVGQMGVMAGSAPVEAALAGDQLSDEQRAKLELVQDVRLYAGETIGLFIDNSYTQLFDTGGNALAYNVSASRRDAFEPHLWWFPFVGAIPHLGYFDRGAADAQVRALQSAGLDVYMYEIDAYSVGAFLPNAVVSTMLERDDIELVDTVIHELLHATIGRPDDNSAGDNVFDESLATFVGRTGALHYYRNRYADQPERVEEAAQRFEDTDRFSRFVLELFAELDAFYGSDLTSEEKISGREAIFQAARDRFESDWRPLMHDPGRFEFVSNLPTNNAYLLLVQRYNLNLDVFAEVFGLTGERWGVALEVYRQAAYGEGDPFLYLQQWIAGH